MQETPAQYMSRILANVEGKDPLAVLAATPRTLSQALAARSDEVLHTRPAPGKWSIAEIVAHLADVEMVVGFRIRLVLGSPGATIQAFDQETWAGVERYNEIPVTSSVDALCGLRALTLRLLHTLKAEQWEQFGMHTERGQESVRKMVNHLAGHDVNHLRQIEAILHPSHSASV